MVCIDATEGLDLSLGLLEHGFCDKASLDLTSRRFGHDVCKEDLLMVRRCYTTLMSWLETYLFGQLELGDAIS